MRARANPTDSSAAGAVPVGALALAGSFDGTVRVGPGRSRWRGPSRRKLPHASHGQPSHAFHGQSSHPSHGQPSHMKTCNFLRYLPKNVKSCMLICLRGVFVGEMTGRRAYARHPDRLSPHQAAAGSALPPTPRVEGAQQSGHRRRGRPQGLGDETSAAGTSVGGRALASTPSPTQPPAAGPPRPYSGSRPPGASAVELGQGLAEQLQAPAQDLALRAVAKPRPAGQLEAAPRDQQHAALLEQAQAKRLVVLGNIEPDV